MNKYLIAALLLCFGLLHGGTSPETSGKILNRLQAAYDVHYYDLDLKVDPETQTISGSNRIHARIVQPTDRIQLNLDTVFTVHSVVMADTQACRFIRDNGDLLVILPKTIQPGNLISLLISYSGAPRSGEYGQFNHFLWQQTPSGDPWIAVSCEGFGADLWWPCKDHISDEADSMRIHLTVPPGLKAVGNGRLESQFRTDYGWNCFNWFVSTPINNYGVSLNIAPYRELSASFTSVSGDSFPFYFWALPENEDKAKAVFPEFQQHLHHLESLLGPYPFRADKYGAAEVPYLGMEHQTIIAYGANYRNDSMSGIDWEFDALHQHELAHEYFGNLVTPFDFRDIWLNEAFATYMQRLYAERYLSAEKADWILEKMGSWIRNKQPIVPEQFGAFQDSYQLDIYMKGAWVLHTLRHFIGDDLFFEVLRTWVYPDESTRNATDGSQCRFASTDDFISLAEKISGQELSWFFDVYLYSAELPELVVQRSSDRLQLQWQTSGEKPFMLPVEIETGGNISSVTVGTADPVFVPLDPHEAFRIDPLRHILMNRAAADSIGNN
jgi:aminopeptidase N